MPYRLKPGVPLVCARNPLGKIVYYYADPPKDMSGPNIPWLSDDQSAHLLRIQLIERIDDAPPYSIVATNDTDSNPTIPTPNTATSEPQPNTLPQELDQLLLRESLRGGIDADRLHACVEAIAALGLPANTGAPKVREALRVAGQSWPNDVICAAVRARKTLAETTV